MIDTAYRELRVVTTGSVTLAPYSLVLLRYGENRRMANVEPSDRGGNGGDRESNG
jgi:hypothetical protein